MNLNEEAMLYEQNMKFRVEKDKWHNFFIATAKEEEGVPWEEAVEQLKRASKNV